MIGQDFVVATLQKSIAAGKIAHAYLFSGPRGCGKTSSARILAKALNCEKGPNATPCGECSACLEIARGSSLDVIEIDGASNTSVNDVRQIKDEVLFPPNSCRYKIYIIDEVHMLSTSAFNALLKTIEEPPPYVIFIFATTELHKVPATIKSRCQHFNFRLVPVELLKESLAAAAAELGITAEDEALFWIAREATGSVRDAYTLFDQIAAFSDGHITYEKIRDKLGLVGVDSINSVVASCAHKDAKAALSALDDILQNGVSVEQFTVDLADYFRSLLLIKSGLTQESLLGQNPERFSADVLQTLSPVQIERALGIMLQLYRDIRYSIDPRYELELAVSRLCWLTDYVSSADMKVAITQARSLLQKGSVTPGAPGNRPAAPVRAEGSGPFSEADRFSGESETIREPDEPVQAPEVDEAPVDENALIEDPFAAIKKRIGGFQAPYAGASASVPKPVAPAVSERASGQAIPAAVPKPVPPVSDIGVSSPAEQPRPESVVPVASVSATSVSPESSAPVPEPQAQEVATPSPVPAIGGEPIPFDQLPEAIAAFFRNTKNTLAVALAEGTGWTDNGTTISFSVEKPFVYTLLGQNKKEITDAVCGLLGRAVSVEILLEQPRPDASGSGGENAIPPQVELVRMMFRGVIQEKDKP
jgi:DNA polymerase-3 subunit gamma/tau